MNKNAKKQAENAETRVCAYNKCSNTFIVRRTSSNQKYCKENSGDQDCSKRANLEKYWLQKYGTENPPPKILEKNKKCGDIECTNTFDLKRCQPNQKYCSEECGSKNKPTYEPTGIKLVEKDKECSYIECTNTFDVYSNNSNKRYCSEECSKEQNKINYYGKVEKIEITKPIEVPVPVDSENSEWITCWVCHLNFKGKKDDWCCSDDCRKSAIRPRTHYAIFNRDGFRCGYCGLSALTNDGVELTLDHIRSWSRSRDDRACNIITSCRACNSEKGADLVHNEEEIYKEVALRNMKYGINPDTIVNVSTKNRKF